MTSASIALIQAQADAGINFDGIESILWKVFGAVVIGVACLVALNAKKMKIGDAGSTFLVVVIAIVIGSAGVMAVSGVGEDIVNTIFS
jgi:hypothetical protein